MTERENQKVILLVEDNPDDEALAIRALKRHHIGNKIVVAHDGVEALDYLFYTGMYADRDIANKPSVVLLDLKLPRIDGLEVLRRVREDPRTKFLPVVVFIACGGTGITGSPRATKTAGCRTSLARK